MKTIDISPGTSIDKAAELLVTMAPASTSFNGIKLRARYATTKPRDIVAKYNADSDMRSLIYRYSPEGRKAAAQCRMDGLIASLPTLPMDDCGAVLAWVAEAADPAVHIGVEYSHEAVTKHFVDAGWGVGVNCGLTFDGDDARNFAGWIVGQWLKSRHPHIASFYGDWREKFAA